MTKHTLQPGTIVFPKHEMREASWARAAVIESVEKVLLKLRTHGTSGDVLAVRQDIIVPEEPIPGPFISLRQYLPYGLWLCGDGRAVLYSRDYKPLWSKMPGEDAVAADPEEFIPFQQEIWFYNDGNTPWRNEGTLRRCVHALKAWGLPIPAFTALGVTLK